MKRRSFLKGLLGAATVVAVPVVAIAAIKPKKFITNYKHVSYSLGPILDWTGDNDKFIVFKLIEKNQWYLKDTYD